MLSKVYQISSHTITAHERIDPDNRLLWRANVRRLDFRSDARFAARLCAASSIGPSDGQPVNLTDEPYSYRRSIYGYIDRGNVPELMSHFDFSDPDMPNSKRSSTIVPQQALFLMNSPLVAHVARSVIARPEVVNSTNYLNKVNNIYKVIFQRYVKPPTEGSPGESALALDFVGKENKLDPQIAGAAKELAEKAGKKASELAKAMMSQNDGIDTIRNTGSIVERKPLTPWETYAQALLLSNEAAYVN